jgi:hypothetical protein
MKKYLAIALTTLLATAAFAGPTEDAVTANEKAAWQAFKDKKADDFKKLISNDLVAVYADGIMNMAAELDAMNKTTMKSFALSDIKVTMTDADTALIAYKCKVESSFDGKDNSGTYNCGSVWRKMGSEWKGVFHTDSKETPAK